MNALGFSPEHSQTQREGKLLNERFSSSLFYLINHLDSLRVKWEMMWSLKVTKKNSPQFTLWSWKYFQTLEDEESEELCRRTEFFSLFTLTKVDEETSSNLHDNWCRCCEKEKWNMWKFAENLRDFSNSRDHWVRHDAVRESKR